MNFKKFVSVLLTFATLISSVGIMEVSSAESTEVSGGFTSEDFLTTKGRKIVNQKGEKITLKGVNLGSWMIWEDWLSPYEEATDHYDILEKLTERFGEEKAYELMNTYMDNWITESDLDEIKAMGFNSVRVPFWFRNFYYDDNGRKILDENGEMDLSRLEWVVEECSKRRLYVVLDLHGAVGYQSDAPHSGKKGSCGLYDDTEQGERYRELTEELWREIATRFKGNPAVAMYDLLNEPMCEVPGDEFDRRKNNSYIYDRLYDAVRAVDSDHIITMECIWSFLALPNAFLMGWKNVIYQVHLYDTSEKSFNMMAILPWLVFFDVPMMMGEFFPHGTNTWENCFKTLDKLGYSWYLWTYKASGHGMWNSNWCLRGSKNGFERAKIETDSYEEIARKWGECIRTENGFQDSGHYERNIESNI
ncbi:MAG: cellulase family glycosylhydrolase [Clostridia bacterium]|nr:cellulase family glycosylhydrolase [Clostridia bacterium]